jgi:glutathione peroxidase
MNVHSFTVQAADGSDVALSDYAGKTLLLVNVASKCGLTPQYAGLEQLHRDFAGKGLQILGFPSNQFGGQEPGTAEEIADFCSTKYEVTFPVLAKIDVNGDEADPLYEFLRAADPGSFNAVDDAGMYKHLEKSYPEWLGTDAVKRNFTKFLVGPDGEVIKRYESGVKPDEIRPELSKLLS